MNELHFEAEFKPYLKPLSHWKLILKFRMKIFAIFLSKVSTFHTGNKLSKANLGDAVDALFDVCKHWLTDQSECSISKISSAKFRKIKHVLNCEIRFRNLFFQNEQININFEIHFQCERGLTTCVKCYVILHDILKVCFIYNHFRGIYCLHFSI